MILSIGQNLTKFAKILMSEFLNIKKKKKKKNIWVFFKILIKFNGNF
jgi:hypothetical protein